MICDEEEIQFSTQKWKIFLLTFYTIYKCKIMSDINKVQFKFQNVKIFHFILIYFSKLFHVTNFEQRWLFRQAECNSLNGIFEMFLVIFILRSDFSLITKQKITLTGSLKWISTIIFKKQNLKILWFQKYVNISFKCNNLRLICNFQ